MKKLNRILSFILAFAMLLSLLPVSAIAEGEAVIEDQNEIIEVEQEKAESETTSKTEPESDVSDSQYTTEKIELQEEPILTEEHIHTFDTLKYFNATESSCEKDGNSEYWYCEDCNLYFLSNEGVLYEVNKNDVVLPASEHTYDETGICSVCGAGNPAYIFEQSKTVEGVKVTVKADAGVFPAGSVLSVKKIDTDKAENSDIQEAVDEKRDADKTVETSYAFDIKVLDVDGDEIQPNGEVNVSFKLDEISKDMNPDLSVDVYHVTEDGKNVSAESIQDKDIEINTAAHEVTVETDGFSVYVIEFTRTDAATELVYEYRLQGTSTVLTDILSNLGLATEGISNVSVNGSTLISAEQVEGVWTISASGTFDTEQTLTVTYSDGSTVEIKIIASEIDIIDCGTCGDNLTWVLYSDGLLEISGAGNMRDYTFESRAPWYKNITRIQKVLLTNDVTSIGSCAFLVCRFLTSITIAEGVTSIGESAFSCCSSLTSITIPEGIKSIGGSAFSDCSSLKSITIPEGVTSIGNYTFKGCSSLTSITIPEGVASIGEYAFNYCSSLTSITIPASLTNIGTGGFLSDCKLLTTAGPIGSGCDLEYGWTDSIPNYAFSGCSSLTSVTIPKGVTNIGGWAFYGCSSLTSITIPEGVASIGEYAFNYCSSLTSITIPASLTNIGTGGFLSDCKLLTTAGPLGSGCNIEYGWTESIPDNALRNCSSLTSITIPEGVTNIGDWAFYGCSSLTSITVPASLDNVRFLSDCKLLTTAGPIGSGCDLEYGWTDSIPNYAFSGCSSLTSVTIPKGVTNIGDWAFYYCSSLVSITIPSSVTSIGYNAFNTQVLERITGYSGTAAEAYAKKFNIAFEALPDGEPVITVNYDTPIKCGTDTVFTVNVTGVEVFKYYLGCIEYEYSDGWYYITDPSRMPGYQESNEFSFKFCASGAYSLRFYIMYVNEKGTYSTKREIVELEIEDDAYSSVSEKIDSVYAECMQAGCSSDYEIALWMHDWLVDHCKYDYSYLYCGAEGALCRGTGTCESYHRAYEMLLKKAGISCRRSEGNGHVWSNVEMDGEWYQIDVTWDDLGYSSSIYDNKHIYFGLTDALMKEVHSDHTAKSGYESNSLENNYYIKSGQIKTFSDQYKAEISEHISSGYDFFHILAKDTLPDGYDRIIINTLVAHQLEKEKWTGNVQLSAEYADGAFYFTVEKIKTITVNPSSIYLSADNPSKTVSVTLNSPTVDSSAYANVVIKVTGQANAYKAVSVDGHCNKDGNTYAVPVGAESAPSFDIVLNAYKSGTYNLQIINGNEILEVPVTITGYSNLPQSGAEFSRIELTKTEITAPETIGITLETEDGFCGDVYGNAWFKCNENNHDLFIELNLNEDGKLSGTFQPEYEAGIFTLEGINLVEVENYASSYVPHDKYYPADELPAEYRNLSFEIYNENADTTGPEIIDISLSKTKVTAPESIEIIVEATDNASGIIHGYVWFSSKKDGIGVSLNLNEEGRLVGEIDTSEKVGEFKLVDMYFEDRCGNDTSYCYGELPVKFRISFNVKNENADIMPPEIISVSLSKTEVTAPEELEVTVDATDDSSGVFDGYARFICKETGVTYDANFDTFDREDGKLAGKLQTENLYGRFDLSELYICDNVGNNQRYYSYQLPAAYRNLYFVVNNDNADVTPPIVEGITLSKTEVTPPDSIEVTIDVTDDISGFQWGDIDFVNNETGEWYSVSFDEDHLTDSIEFTNLDEIGHYEIESIYVEDVAGNAAYYGNYAVDDVLPIEEKFRDLAFDVLSTEYYSISKNRSGKGTITVSVNGSVPVGYAKENDTVKVSLNAYNGFKFVPGSLSVKTKTDKIPVSVVDNTFIMPSCDVEIFADFEQDIEIEKYLPYKITDIQMDEDSYEYGDAAKIRVKIDGQGINGVNAYFCPPDASSFYSMPMVTLNKNGEYFEGVLRLQNLFPEGEWKLSCIEITDTNGDMFYFENRDSANASISDYLMSLYDWAYVDLSAATFMLGGSPVENPYAITELYAIKATYKYGESIEIRFKVSDNNANSAFVVLEGPDGERYYVSNIQKNKSGYFILNKRITNQMETGKWTVAVITTYDKNGNGYKFMNPWWDNDYNVDYNWEMEAIAEKVCDLSSADFTINGTKPDKDYTITNIKVGKASYLANEEVKIRLNVAGPDIDYVELHVSGCAIQTAVKVSGTNTYEAAFVCTEPGEYNIEGIVIVDKYGNEYPYCNVMADDYWSEEGPYRDFSAGDFEVLNGYGYVLRFDGNGSIKGKVEDIYYQADAVITLPENGYIRSNYMFTCWNTRRDGTGNAYMSGEEVCNIMLSNTYPTVLYAQWKATEYSIRYELNGGKNSAENPVTYTVQTPTIALQEPTKEGYTFGGWYKDKSYRTKITEIVEGSTGDITLYAKWTANKYTVHFDRNGNTVIGNMADQVLTYDGMTALRANAFRKTGYMFAGWTETENPDETVIPEYTDKMALKNLTAEPNGTVTLYAVWKPYVTEVRLYTGETDVTGGSLNAELYGAPTVQLTAVTMPENAAKAVNWTTSSASIATVSKEGLITFVNPGSVTITATSTDGTNKKAIVKYNVVYFNSDSGLKVVPEGIEFKYIDGAGNIAEEGVVTDNYAVFTDAGSAVTFNIRTYGKLSTGESVEITKKNALKYTSTGTSIATVTANADGSATVKIPKTASGACTIDVVTTDASKRSGSIAVYVQDKAPRLEVGSVTIDTYKDESVSIPYVESYENHIQRIEILEYNARTRKYDISNRIFAIQPWEEGYEKDVLKLYVSESIPNGNIKTLVRAETEDGRSYDSVLTVVSKSALPAITVTQKDKFDLFYKDSAVNITVTAKSGKTFEKINGVTLVNERFELIKNEEIENTYTVKYADGKENANNSMSLTVYVDIEGYKYPVAKTFTLGNITRKPSITITPGSGTVNRTIAGNIFALSFTIYDKTNGKAIQATSPDGREQYLTPNVDWVGLWNGENGMTIMQVNDFSESFPAKGGKVTIAVRDSAWAQSLYVTYNVSVKDGWPTATLEKPMLTLNRYFINDKQSTELKLSVANTDISIDKSNIELMSVPRGVFKETAEEWFCFEINPGNRITVGLTEKTVATVGTYTFRIIPRILGYEINPVTLTVKVDGTQPKITMKPATLTLNNVFTGTATETAVTFNQSGVELTGIDTSLISVPKGVDKETAAMWFRIYSGTERNRISVEFNHPLAEVVPAGTYKFDIIPIIEKGDDRDVKLTKTVLTVNVTGTLPKVILKQPTLTLNNVFTGVTAETAVSVNQSDVKLKRIETSLISAPKNVDKTIAEYWFDVAMNEEGNRIQAKFNEYISEVVPAGTYKFSIKPVAEKDEVESEIGTVILTVNVNSTQPKTILKQSALTLNNVFTKTAAETAVSFNQSDVKLTGIISELTSVPKGVDKLAAEYWFAVDQIENKIQVRFSDSLVGVVPAGTYKFDITPVIEKGTDKDIYLAKVVLTVNVNGTLPKATLKQTTLMLNNVFTGTVAETAIVFNQNSVKLTDIAPKLTSVPKGVDRITAEYWFSFDSIKDENKIRIKFCEPLVEVVPAGTYKFDITPVIEREDDKGINLAKVVLTVNVSGTLPKATLKQPTLTLNNIFKDTAAETAVTFNQNSVKLTGIDNEKVLMSVPKGVDKTVAADWFEIDKIQDENRIQVRIKESHTDTVPAGTYRFSILPVVEKDGVESVIGAVTLTVNVNGMLPSYKLSAGNVTLNKAFTDMTVDINVLGLEKYDITGLEINPTGSAVVQAQAEKIQIIPEQDEETELYTGKIQISLNPEDLPSGTSYTFSAVPYVTGEGAVNQKLKATTFTVKLVNTIPTVSFSGVTLNKRLSETGTAAVKLSAKGYTVDDFECMDGNENLNVTYDREESVLKVSLTDIAKTKKPRHSV